MDPRFKLKMDNDYAILDRLRSAAVAEMFTGAEEVFPVFPACKTPLQRTWDG